MSVPQIIKGNYKYTFHPSAIYESQRSHKYLFNMLYKASGSHFTECVLCWRLDKSQEQAIYHINGLDQ